MIKTGLSAASSHPCRLAHNTADAKKSRPDLRISIFPRRSARTLLCTCAFILLAFSPGSTASAHPQEVGNRVANNIISRDMGKGYACICSYYGVCIFSEATDTPELLSAVVDKYQPYVTGQKTPPDPGHVDWNVFGILPFELYRQTGNYDDYIPLAKYYADTEFENPRPDGLSAYTRFWVDDMYMVGSLQAQAHKSLGDPNYINNGVTQLLGYIEEVEDLQQPNGLFHHAYNSPYFWGRGNGWAAAAMTETLLTIPPDHPKRDQLMSAYQRMMAGLLNCQDQTGMWYQVLDLPDDPNNWLETSCSGMFVFALATGVQQGWLTGDEYSNAAIDGWTALEDYVDRNGQVREVCVGTGKGSSVQHYFDRPRRLADFHGQAGVIWAATAMVRSELIVDGDFDHNGSVNIIDFARFAQHWGLTTRTGPAREPCEPAGHWPLDETEGAVAHDLSPNAAHGAASGIDWQPQGKFDAAADFDSEFDRIEIPISAASASRGTISLWCKLHPDPQPTRHVYLFGHSTSPYYSNRIQLYTNNGDRALDLGLGDSHAIATGLQTLLPQTWHHIALTWDDGSYSVFVDGILKTEGTYTALTSLNSTADIGNDGRLDGSQRHEAFNGLIDDVQLYDYPLAAPEMGYLAGLDGSYIPFPQHAIQFDLFRDDLINPKDLTILLQNWLTGK